MDPLLQQYRQTHDPADFRRIIDGHIDAVYSQCVRQLHDRHLAEDVTQAVFFMLARKADRLPRGTIVGGWLFTAARYACANARRSEERRRRHEREARRMRSETGGSGVRQDSISAVEAAEQDEIERSLNDAIASLPSGDRDVVALRFFQSLSMLEVGRRIGVSEEAARKRVGRAVARLRRMFAGRGVGVDDATLQRTLAGVAMIQAPAGLAILAAKAVTGEGGATAIGAGALKAMAAAKVKLAAATALLAAGAVAVSVLAVIAIERGGVGDGQARAATGPIPAPVTLAAAVSSTTPASPALAAGVASDDLTTQLAGVLMRMARAVREHDVAALDQELFSDSTDRSRLLLGRIHYDVNIWWLRRTWDKVFPNQRSAVLSRLFGRGGRAPDEDLDEVWRGVIASGMNSAVVEEAADRAILPVENTDPGPSGVDRGAGGAGAASAPTSRVSGGIIVLHYRRIDGHWKLDLGRTFGPMLPGMPQQPPGDAMERQADAYIRRLDAYAAFAATAARELESGAYKSSEAADAALAARAKALPAGVRIDLAPVDRH